MTIIDKINAKFDRIYSMFVEYNALSAHADRVQDAIFDKDGTYRPEKHHEWCRLFDENMAYEKKIRRAVRALVKDMGFEIVRRDVSLCSEYENVFNEMRRHWERATTTMTTDNYWNNEFRVVKPTGQDK